MHCADQSKSRPSEMKLFERQIAAEHWSSHTPTSDSSRLWVSLKDKLRLSVHGLVRVRESYRVLEQRKTTESKVCFNSSTLLIPLGIGVITKTDISEEQTSTQLVQENLHIACHGVWEACHPFPTNVLLKSAASTQLCNTSHDRPSSSEPPTFIQRAPTRPWASSWRKHYKCHDVFCWFNILSHIL